ncbi:MAG: GNAT family N-acetyltransferase [Fibrobacterota bacterium]
MSEVTIRKAEIRDIPDIMDLCANCFLEEARNAAVAFWNFNRGFRDFPDYQIVAELDGRIAGFQSGRELRPEKNGGRNLYELGLIGVDSSCKGRGIGGILLDEVEKIAQEHGYEGIRLGTPFAVSFYEKYGYKLVDSEKKYITKLNGRVLEYKEGTEVRRSLKGDLRKYLEWVEDDEKKLYLAGGFYKALNSGAVFEFTHGGLCAAVIFMNRLSSSSMGSGVVFGNVPGVVFEKGFDEDALIKAILAAGQSIGFRKLGLSGGEKFNDEKLRQAGFEAAAEPEFWSLKWMEKSFK